MLVNKRYLLFCCMIGPIIFGLWMQSFLAFLFMLIVFITFAASFGHAQTRT